MRLRLIALAALSGLLLALMPGSAQAAKPRYKVIVKVSTKAPIAGQALTVYGKVVGPKTKGTKVAIQAKYPGRGYTTIARAKISAKGVYRTKVKLTKAGATTIRVVKSASKVRRAGVRTTTVTTWKWLELTTQKRLDEGDAPAIGTASVAGKSYSPAFTYTDGGSYFKVGNACSTFTASIGAVTGATEPAGYILLASSADSGTIKISQIRVPINQAPLEDTNSISRFSVIAFGSTGDAPVVIVKPRVLCTVDALPQITSSELPAL